MMKQKLAKIIREGKFRTTSSISALFRGIDQRNWARIEKNLKALGIITEGDKPTKEDEKIICIIDKILKADEFKLFLRRSDERAFNRLLKKIDKNVGWNESEKRRFLRKLLEFYKLYRREPTAAFLVAPYHIFTHKIKGRVKISDNPRIIFVFSGGGTKGFAYLSALKVFADAGIFPDIAVGTSVGALAAALAVKMKNDPAVLNKAEELFTAELVMKIFSRNLLIMSWRFLVSTIKSWFGKGVQSAFGREKLKKALENVFGIATLKDLPGFFAVFLANGKRGVAGRFDKAKLSDSFLVTDILSGAMGFPGLGGTFVIGNVTNLHTYREGGRLKTTVHNYGNDAYLLEDAGIVTNLPLDVAMGVVATLNGNTFEPRNALIFVFNLVSPLQERTGTGIIDAAMRAVFSSMHYQFDPTTDLILYTRPNLIFMNFNYDGKLAFLGKSKEDFEGYKERGEKVAKETLKALGFLNKNIEW